MMIVLIVRPFTIEVVSIPEGILHPDTRFGLAYGTSMVRNWYRDVKYPGNQAEGCLSSPP